MKFRMTTAGFFGPARAGLAALVVMAGAAALLPAAPAAAQDSNLARQLDRLRRDLNDLQRYVYKGERPPEGEAPEPAGDPGVMSRMQVQITQMQDQMRSMNGRVEEVEHRIMVMEQRLDRMAQDLEFRLQAIEDKVGVGGAAQPADESATPEPTGGATQTALAAPGGLAADATPRQQYDHAFELLKDRNYDAAATALQAFLDRNPDDPLAGNALYWLGETRYVQKDYKEAAKVFLDGYKRFPEGAKAPDNLLKLGMSLAALDETDSACKTFAKLRSSFPQAPSRVLRAAESEQKKLKCP